MSILSKSISRFNTIPIKISARYFEDKVKIILKLYGKAHEETRIAETVLKKKNEVGQSSLFDFKTYSVATVTKIVCYWQRDRHIDSRNRIDNIETHSPMYSQIIFLQRCKGYLMEER